MVVACGTSPVDDLSVRAGKRVDLSSGRQVLELSIDGGQPDSVAGGAQVLVQLLRASESLCIVERVLDRGPLAGDAAQSLAHSNTLNATIVATPATRAITWTTDLAGSGSLWSSGMRSVLAM